MPREPRPPPPRPTASATDWMRGPRGEDGQDGYLPSGTEEGRLPLRGPRPLREGHIAVFYQELRSSDPYVAVMELLKDTPDDWQHRMPRRYHWLTTGLKSWGYTLVAVRQPHRSAAYQYQSLARWLNFERSLMDERPVFCGMIGRDGIWDLWADGKV